MQSMLSCFNFSSKICCMSHILSQVLGKFRHHHIREVEVDKATLSLGEVWFHFFVEGTKAKSRWGFLVALCHVPRNIVRKSCKKLSFWHKESQSYREQSNKQPHASTPCQSVNFSVDCCFLSVFVSCFTQSTELFRNWRRQLTPPVCDDFDDSCTFRKFLSSWTHNQYSPLWVTEEPNFSESAGDKSYLLVYDDFDVSCTFCKFQPGTKQNQFS